MSDFGLPYMNVGAGKSPNYALQVNEAWTNRAHCVCLVNGMMIMWYMRRFATGVCNGLEDRLIFLWLPLSTVNLYAEHKSSEQPYDSKRFLEHALLNSFHYLAGYSMLYDLSLWFSVPLVTLALLEYFTLCYLRYYLSETKLHRYSVIFEIIITAFILPGFLVTDLLMKHPPEQQFFWPYVMIDVVLKVMRTTFLYYFRDEFHDDPFFFGRRESWATPVTSNSLLELAAFWKEKTA